MTSQQFALALAMCLTGLMAGIFFTWSNAVKPGIGQLSDLEYLKSFQSMNRVILNPSFKTLFIGAIVSTVIVPICYFNSSQKYIFWFVLIAFLIYWLGVFIITVLGNIPLNEILDKSNLEGMSVKELQHLRVSIERKWNNYNLIRSISSVVTFLLLMTSTFYQ
ncbi:anthrone oxygenase family protein [Flammeovirga agarivorans]|uniref:DUF1772 domain-containing protein n=1 Tax=Flammeovirga agarivorans TaxID=2726742 RepID=A0A7X8XVY5_9BACT|nr:anthrone oxygenase family protein [Flammeovirga agarivorans]NLR91741.1 DUF1772 domain-containing protein [Flammeovirga agarivorans]